MRKKKTSNRYGELTQKLGLPLNLENGEIPKFQSNLLSIGFFLLISLVVWGSVAKIEELTVANGSLIPKGDTKLVQHFEGGIVSEILVEAGQKIRKGEVIVRLHPTDFQVQEDNNENKIASLSLRLEKLNSLITARKPKFAKWQKQYPNFVKNEIAILKVAKTKVKNEIEVLKYSIEQSKLEVVNAKINLESDKKQITLLKEDYQATKRLYEQGLASATTYSEIARNYEGARAGVATSEKSMQISKEALKENISKLEVRKTEIFNEWINKKSETEADLANLINNSKSFNEKVQRAEVKSPVNGVVFEIIPKTIGEVIGAGNLIAQILPGEQELIADIKILPKDIGYVKENNPVNIKITTFDTVVYGKINGYIQSVSATTFLNEKGEPFYKGTVALEKQSIGNGKNKKDLQPGMIINAEIITGSKSIVVYMLKPIFRAYDIAFSER